MHITTYNFKLFFTVLLLAVVTSGLKAQNWTRAQGSPTIGVPSITLQNGIFYAISEDSIYQSADNGTSWQTTPGQTNLSDWYSAIYSYRNVLYVGTLHNGLARSTDSGKTWQNFNSGLTGWGLNIADFAGLGDSLYLATDGAGIFVTSLTSPGPWQIYDYGLFQYGATTIYAYDNTIIANAGMYVFIRERGSNSWTDIYIDSTTGQLPATKFFRFGDYLFAGSEEGVHRGWPSGLGWKQVGISLLPNLVVDAFACHGDSLFANVRLFDETFICLSTDTGKTWNVFAHEYAILYDMVVSGDRLIACRSDGIWYYDFNSSPNSVTPEKGTIPATFALRQNYPNPFNPKTDISFDVSTAGFVNVTVYDVLGNEVAVLVNESLQPGSYKATWNATHAPSGVYFTRYTAGNFTDVKKMILMK